MEKQEFRKTFSFQTVPYFKITTYDVITFKTDVSENASHATDYTHKKSPEDEWLFMNSVIDVAGNASISTQ